MNAKTRILFGEVEELADILGLTIKDPNRVNLVHVVDDNSYYIYISSGSKHITLSTSNYTGYIFTFKNVTKDTTFSFNCDRIDFKKDNLSTTIDTLKDRILKYSDEGKDTVKIISYTIPKDVFREVLFKVLNSGIITDEIRDPNLINENGGFDFVNSEVTELQEKRKITKYFSDIYVGDRMIYKE